MVYPPRQTAFDVLLYSRFVKKAGLEPEVDLSLQPGYSSDGFTLRLSISPMHITDLSWREGWKDWLNYAMLFVNRLEVSSGPFSFQVADDLILPGDLFGVTSAFTGSFDPRSSLKLLSRYDGSHYSHVLTFSDIGFEQDAGHLGFSASIQPFGWPVQFAVGLLSAIDYESLQDSGLYPQLSMMLPLYYSDRFEIFLDLTGAVHHDGKKGRFDGWGLDLSAPMTYGALSFTTGLSYTRGDLHYGEYLNGYRTGRRHGNTLMFHSSLLYEGTRADIILDAQLPIDLSNGGLVRDEDYFSLEIAGHLHSIDISAGIRMAGLFSDPYKAFTRRGQAFISLAYSNQVLSTCLSFYFTENLQPQVALSTTLGAYDALFSRSGELATSPSWLDLTLYTGYILDSDASIILMPNIRFDFDRDISFALRLPLALSTSQNRVVIVTGDDDPWFDFGIGQESTQAMILDLFTDIFSLVEEMRFGNMSSSIYFIATRRDAPLPDLFDMYRPFGSDDGLSLNTGFNVPGKASVNLFSDNLEDPRILDMTVSMMPMGNAGPMVTGEIALEFGGKDGGYDILLAPQLSIAKSFLDGALDVSLFLNTYITFSSHGIDMNIFSSDDLEFASGLALDAGFAHFSIPLSLGVAAGRAREHYWNEFSWRDGSSIEANGYLDDPSFFLHAGLLYESDVVSAGFMYDIDSFSIPGNGEASQDRLRIILSFQMNDFSISMLWSRRNLIGSISDIQRPEWWTDGDNLWSLTISKTFGHLGLYASLYLEREADTALGFSMITSLRF